MTDIDAEDAEDEIAPRRVRQRKGESLIGNILEGVFTYGAPAMIYTPMTFLMVFGFADPATEGDKVTTLVMWILLNSACTIAFAVGAAIGSDAKFSSRPLRLFLAGIAALTPLLLPVIMMVRGGDGTFVAGGLDWLIAGLSVVQLAAAGALIYLMHTAVRRVREVSRE